MVSFFFFFFFNLFLFIYLFLAALGFRCCTRAFSSCSEGGATLPCGVQASHCCGFSCYGAWALGTQAPAAVARGLQSTGSVVVAHGPSCSAACGILPDLGSNPCPLHWQADSQPLSHQGSPRQWFLKCNTKSTETKGKIDKLDFIKI